MNPYLSTAIAMCVIVLLSLAGTAYLAAALNRRAKNDLQARLEPLAAVIDGEVDLEEGCVEGRFQGQIAVARVANAAVIMPIAVSDRAATISVRGSMRSAKAALGARVSRRSSPEEPSTNPTTVIGAPSASIQSGQMPT